MKSTERVRSAVDTDDVDAVAEFLVATQRHCATEAQQRRALEAYRRACEAERRRQAKES